MAVTPFTRALGIEQGRIVPTRIPADAGDRAFVLGSEATGRVARLASGDHVTITQTDTLAGQRYLRPEIHLRPPAGALPVGCSWRVEYVVNAVVVLSVPIDRERNLTDVAAVLSQIVGSFGVAFRLVLTAPAGLHEVELPLVQVDALSADATAGPQVVNRLPEPNETDVPRSTMIALDLNAIADDNFLSGSINVSVNGVPAVVNDVIVAPFNGGGSSIGQRDDSYTIRIVLDPTSDFTSLQTVTVAGSAVQSADSAPLNFSYSFEIEDFTPPRLVAAQARDRRTVRVEFNEAVVLAEALTPLNWTLTIVAGQPVEGWGDFRVAGATWAIVEAVAQVSDRVFDLTMDVPLTMAATYRVKASGIHDPWGNLVDTIDDAEQFVAVDSRDPLRAQSALIYDVPSMNVIEDATFDLRKFIWVWQELTDLGLATIDEWTRIIDPEVAPIEFVDAKLLELGNPFTFTLTDHDKRRLCFLLASIFEEKGTAEGIVNTIRLFMGLEVEISYPTFEGAPLDEAELGEDPLSEGTFILGGDAFDDYGYDIVSAIYLTEDQRQKIRGIAEYMQATNEHLNAIREPESPPAEPDHLQLDLSQLDVNWELHA